MRNVLHQKDIRLSFAEGTEVLTPQGSPLQADAAHVQRREALARRPTDDNVNRGESLNPLDWPTDKMIPEVAPICLGSIAITLDRKDRSKLATVQEAARQAPAPGEEVDES